jgi:hypothetical protein
MKFCISLLRNSVFNLGENPYIELKKVKHTIKERKKKIALIAIFNN